MSVHKPKKFREPQAAHKRSRSSYEQPHGCVNSRTLKTKGEGERKKPGVGQRKDAYRGQGRVTADSSQRRGKPEGEGPAVMGDGTGCQESYTQPKCLSITRLTKRPFSEKKKLGEFIML